MKRSFVAFAASLQLARISAGLVAPRDDWPVCAWIGWDTRESFWSSTDGTYPACSAACFSQPNCKSFSYTKGDCNLYDVNVQTNINWDISSPYLFWDRNCEIKFQSCNTKAYQAKFDAFFWSNTLNQDACTSACVSNSNCKSLAWGNGECYLYNVPTKGNMDGPGNYLFSDVGCFKPSVSVTASFTVTASLTVSPVILPVDLKTSSTTSSTTTSTKRTTPVAITTSSTKATVAGATTTTSKQASTTSTKATTTKTTTTTTKSTTTTRTTTMTTKPTTTTTKTSANTSKSSSTTTK